MKKEWKPDELRATSEEIRGAVMPKSITPEMVGGTFLGVLDALGEVVDVLGEIPREHVRVKVRGYDGEGAVSAAGATVWLDVFHTKGYPCVSLPRQELTCDKDGVVEFDVPHGYRYAVFSQIAGLGASFQMVKVAATESRELTLWNLPIGIKHLYFAAYYCDDHSPIMVPVVFDHFRDGIEDWDDEDEVAPWIWDMGSEDDGWWLEDWGHYGILVSTAETSFVIAANSKSSETMWWCNNRDFGTLIPTLPYINYHINGRDYAGDYDEAKERAIADYDGNMNTAKILDFCVDPIAANFCASKHNYWDEVRWLPSAGQMYLIYMNATAINALMQEALDAGYSGFDLLPYKKSNGSWDHYEYWWTSTVFDLFCSWVVNYNGGINNYYRNDNNHVRAVSAFHFEY